MVGGSGERQTLRIVAKYGDACNLFGSAQTVKRKLSISKEHCRGRDYDSILKTKLGVVVIDGDKETARKRLQHIINVPEEQVNEFAIYSLTYYVPEFNYCAYSVMLCILICQKVT